MQRRPFFFGLHLTLGAKLRNKIELLSLTKLRRNISPPQNFLNQPKSTPMPTTQNCALSKGLKTQKKMK